MSVEVPLTLHQKVITKYLAMALFAIFPLFFQKNIK